MRAASVISSVLALAKPENGREWTKAAESIRKRQIVGVVGVTLKKRVITSSTGLIAAQTRTGR
jgi:hypothetical protein